MQPPADYTYSSEEAKEWFAQPTGEWADNSLGNCQVCNVHFNLLPLGYYRRHHCRKCGKLICQNCSVFPPNYPHENMGSGSQERMCRDCSVPAAVHFGDKPLTKAIDPPTTIAAVPAPTTLDPATVTIDIDVPSESDPVPAAPIQE